MKTTPEWDGDSADASIKASTKSHFVCRKFRFMPLERKSAAAASDATAVVEASVLAGGRRVTARGVKSTERHEQIR